MTLMPLSLNMNPSAFNVHSSHLSSYQHAASDTDPRKQQNLDLASFDYGYLGSHASGHDLTSGVFDESCVASTSQGAFSSTSHTLAFSRGCTENEAPLHSENYQYDAPLHLQPSVPSYSLSSTTGWQWQADLELSSLPYSPLSDQPCPRISKLAGPATQSTSSHPQTPLPHQDLQIHYTSQQKSELAYDYSPAYSQRSLPRFRSPVSSPDTWLTSFEPSAQSSSGSGHQTSRPVSPQSSSSDSAECTARPRQRRRLSPSSSVFAASDAFTSSDTGNASDSSFNCSSKPSKKARGSKGGKRGRQSKNTTSAGASFTTFMVNPTALNHEPAGATYMSTVDFKTDSADGAQHFEHGPTDLPPRQYIGGGDVNSPWKPRKNLGTIPGSALDYLPIVEGRMARLERALNAYVKHRGDKALQNSVVSGMDMDVDDGENITSEAQGPSADS